MRAEEGEGIYEIAGGCAFLSCGLSDGNRRCAPGIAGLFRRACPQPSQMTPWWTGLALVSADGAVEAPAERGGAALSQPVAPVGCSAGAEPAGRRRWGGTPMRRLVWSGTIREMLQKDI